MAVSGAIEEHRLSPGEWPSDFPLNDDGTVAEGLAVWSQSRRFEGRTTGSRLRCSSLGCPGWFIGVSWETGQGMRPCSEGWQYFADDQTIHITGGGDISARFVSPRPLGTPPLPAVEWPRRADLVSRKGWRVTGVEPLVPPKPLPVIIKHGCRGEVRVPANFRDP